MSVKKLILRKAENQNRSADGIISSPFNVYAFELKMIFPENPVLVRSGIVFQDRSMIRVKSFCCLHDLLKLTSVIVDSDGQLMFKVTIRRPNYDLVVIRPGDCLACITVTYDGCEDVKFMVLDECQSNCFSSRQTNTHR